MVGIIPRTIGNVRLPTVLSPFKSPISPRGPKMKKKAKKDNAAYIIGSDIIILLVGAAEEEASSPPNKDSNPAPAAVTTVFRGNLSFKLNFGCEYVMPNAIKEMETNNA
jgi:hypothetical protein